ncbi:uncharacterized protein LOC106438807 isoform X10 [Brassica napus]|uniref:uncharacterized protein LOC106438807 isoform X10 n=1 Tax=Brassica napus TaxID=3708 RepID=UPI0020789DBF|nr:uncharacterized protein LOC106438807 isoform X10 [Brassica napus]
MANEKPITTETVALTEKKMDMSLDAIIKMSKRNNTNVNKGKKLRASVSSLKLRASNKKEKFNGAAKNSTVKAQRYMDSRSDVRQGAFAKRRSNFQGPVTTAVARDVASGAPIRGRPYNAGRMANTNQSRFITPPAQYGSAPRGFVSKQWEKIEQKQPNGGGQRQGPQTLDSRFANMKEERMRMRMFTEKGINVGNNGVGLQYHQQQQRPWGRRAARFPN